MREHVMGPLAEACERRLLALEEAGFARRIADRDASLWKPGDPAHARVIVDRLGWLDSPAWMAERLEAVEGLAAELRAEGFRKALLLGMGGSSLCPEVLRRSFGAAEGAIDVEVLDSTHPDAVRAAESGSDPERTFFIVASKSGGTAEVKALYAYFHGKTPDGGRFVAITDPGSPLAELAEKRRFRRTFLNAPDVGGRYSALSYFGMVPAAFLGIETRKLLEHGQELARACGPDVPPLANPGLELGIALAEAALAGRDKLTLVLPPGLAALGSWIEQLVAESTGKEGQGVLPVDGEVLGGPEVYGADRFFVVLRDVSGEGRAGIRAGPGGGGGDAEDSEARLEALAAAGHPIFRIDVQGRYGLGAEFFRWEYATAVCSAILGVNAFDEPNVREAKELTARALEGVVAAGGRAPVFPRAGGGGPGFRGFLDRARPGDYVALLAYLPLTAPNEAALRSLAGSIRERTRLAVTVGVGPRYLHSTGQYHKGGPDKGIFLLVAQEGLEDLGIPGEPYGFGGLCGAQVLGDLGALEAHGRRVARLAFQGEPAAALGDWRRTQGI